MAAREAGRANRHDEVNGHLADHGISLCPGTLVGATVIDAPSLTRNEAKARDPEMLFTKTGNDWYFGMKAHVGVDVQRGIVHGLNTTPAKTQGSHVWDELPHGKETWIWADKGYVSATRQAVVPTSSGGHAQGAERRRASSHWRKHQPDHRQGAGPGRASIPRAHAPVRRHQDRLSGSCEKSRGAVHAVGPWQSVPRLRKIDGLSRTLPEIRLSEGEFIAFGSFQHWGPEQGVELACE